MGAQTVGIDLSQGMLHQAQTLGTGGFTLVQADAAALPFADRTFDVAFTAFGALPFVSALVAVHREVARVLRPGGRWVFSTTHPFAWVFPESSRPEDLRVQRSYFGLEPYFERADDGHLTYAEYHATFQDHVNSLVEAGFTIRRMLEPQWGSSGAAEGEWAAWGRERGELVPSTLIIAAQLVACRC
jgi:ubiquinone/menaquinone biosynthesis C-methylase UbiE